MDCANDRDAVMRKMFTVSINKNSTLRVAVLNLENFYSFINYIEGGSQFITTLYISVL